MVFYFNGNGELIKTISEPIFQGSNKASTIYAVAPISANATLGVSFKLPNGHLTPQMAMVRQGQLGVITAPSDALFSVWSVNIPSQITAYAGVVTAQFFITEYDQIIATASANFNVNKGVPAKLPDAPSEDAYAEILTQIQLLTETVFDNSAGTNGFTFTTEDKFAAVQEYNGSALNVIIPEWHISDGNYYLVTAINDFVFNGRSIKSVVIPESVTTIKNAFSNTDIKSIRIPKSVITLDNAFLNASELKLVVFEGALPELIGSVFTNTASQCKVFVKPEYYSDYKTALLAYSNVLVVTTATSEDLVAINTSLSSLIIANRAAITKEIIDRENAVSEISDNLTKETKARTDSDTALTNRIKAVETEAGGLSTSIENEKTMREAADEEISNAITELQNNLANFYTKKETYSKSEINNLISTLEGGGLTLEKVDSLPSTGNSKVIYLVPVAGSNGNVFDEYIWFNSAWEKIGSTSVNLADYYTKIEIAELLKDYLKKEDIDTTLSTTSENPVQNKVLTEELGKKITAPPASVPIRAGDEFSDFTLDTTQDLDEWLLNVKPDEAGNIIILLPENLSMGLLYGLVQDGIGVIADTSQKFLYFTKNTPEDMLAQVGATHTGWQVESYSLMDNTVVAEAITSGELTLPFKALLVAEKQNFVYSTVKGSALLQRTEEGTYEWTTLDLIKESVEAPVLTFKGDLLSGFSGTLTEKEQELLQDVNATVLVDDTYNIYVLRKTVYGFSGRYRNIDTREVVMEISGSTYSVSIKDYVADTISEHGVYPVSSRGIYTALQDKLNNPPESASVGAVPTKTADGYEWKEIEGGANVVEKEFQPQETETASFYMATFTEDEFALLTDTTVIKAIRDNEDPVMFYPSEFSPERGTYRYISGGDGSYIWYLVIMPPAMGGSGLFSQSYFPSVMIDNTWTGANDFTGGLKKNGVDVATVNDISSAGGDPLYMHNIKITIYTSGSATSSTYKCVTLYFNYYDRQASAYTSAETLFSKILPVNNTEFAVSGDYVDKPTTISINTYLVNRLKRDSSGGYDVVYYESVSDDGSTAEAILGLTSYLSSAKITDNITEV